MTDVQYVGIDGESRGRARVEYVAANDTILFDQRDVTGVSYQHRNISVESAKELARALGMAIKESRIANEAKRPVVRDNLTSILFEGKTYLLPISTYDFDNNAQRNATYLNTHATIIIDESGTVIKSRY